MRLACKAQEGVCLVSLWDPRNAYCIADKIHSLTYYYDQRLRELRPVVCFVDFVLSRMAFVEGLGICGFRCSVD
jgi:hypothetical protein